MLVRVSLYAFSVDKPVYSVFIYLLENMEGAIIVTVVDKVGRIEEETEPSLIICGLE